MITLHLKMSQWRMFLFLAFILKKGHDQCGTLKEYWSKDTICYIPFYSHDTKHNKFFQVLQFLHDDLPDRDTEDYDRL
jgi:hypothetical protein